jgi:DUF4097 and DUF4098 domain-containing protein YvlB
MKKRTIVWLLIATIMVIVGSSLFVGAMMKVNWDFRKLSTVQYETNRYEFSESVGDISIDTVTADIELVPSEGPTVSVVCLEESRAKHSVTVQDGTLIIEVDDERKWYDHIGIHFGNPKITVYLPAGEYGALSVKVTTGDTTISKDFSFESMEIKATTGDVKTSASVDGSLQIKATTGDIRAENLSAGAMELTVTTGDVTLSSITSEGAVQVNVGSGDAKFTDVSCRSLRSDGTTGDLILKNVIVFEAVSLERTTGDIKLERCDAAELLIKSTTGDIQGSLLSEKIFLAHATTGDVSVPKSTVGGKCELTTTTGDIYMTVESK